MKNAGNRRWRAQIRALIALWAVAGWACSGNKESTETIPSQTLTQVTPQLAAPPPPLPPPIREIQPSRPTVKVIDPGGDDDQPKSLLEASRLAKARKGQTKESIAVINDENLHEYAKDAEVILLDSPPAAPVSDLEPPPRDEGDEIRDEQYWRGQALELRMGWRRTIDRITELELESAALRQQFYAEEDPYLRDSQLKPAWDRVLDRLDQLRETASRYSQELEVLVNEGQRAGVPQGWLNQGWELEPTTEERKSLERFPAAEAVDPPAFDIEEGDS
ncbi:MAG: hypothetical protein GY719_30045 [bacterium]|nr:hypothetical protein [bacterium]